MGGKKQQVIGFWYRPLMHFGLGQGELDAFLEFRGGERTAWKGEQTESGRIYVDAMNLWGGEKSEGGIASYVDVMMGEADQEPNDFLAAHLGPMQPAYRGIASLVFRGGRYGAMNPYPKPASFKVRRIKEGWDHDDASECWYPEKAAVPMEGWTGLSSLYAEWFSDGLSNWTITYPGSEVAFVAETASGKTCCKVGPTPPAMVSVEMVHGMPVAIASSMMRVRFMVVTRDPDDYGVMEFGNLTYNCGIAIGREGAANRVNIVWPGAGPEIDGSFLLEGAVDLALGTWYRIELEQTGTEAQVRILYDVTGAVYAQASRAVTTPVPGINRIRLRTDGASQGVVRWTGLELLADSAGGAMNPAHIILDSLISPSMQGEPIETINLVSFTEAADKLHAEGFGLCTKYNADRESIEQFRQRICNVIAARCSRSRVDGQWYLDLIRDDFDLDALPALTDDDILDFEEETGTIDDATNQVSVEWFDPEVKETRTTAPLQALGAIQAAGSVNAELLQFPEIPLESLALRVGTRELYAKAQLPRRHRLVCNRTPYAWRIGQRFRLQAPKRGIADMVCMVGDSDAGTLLSGAVRLVSMQDVYGMPETTYIAQQPVVDDTDKPPRGSPQQRLIELPYVELVSTLSNADLQALPEGVGYVAALATAPSVGQEFALYTKADGEEYGEGTIGNWCPGFTLQEAASRVGTTFTVAAGSRLALLEVGQRLLWENEECRLDDFDPETGVVVLGRGVADTVPSPHAAGTVLYGYDQWHAVDGRDYADGETVSAKLLTRTGTQIQEPGEAPTLTVEIAARKDRPYPPAKLRLNGETDPSYLFGEIVITWVHRDRLLQADQLIDNEMSGVGPEAGTTYTMRTYVDTVLDDTQSGIVVTTASVTPSTDGNVRIEIESERDSLTGWQMQVREFAWTAIESTPLQMETGELITTQTNEPIFME